MIIKENIYRELNKYISDQNISAIFLNKYAELFLKKGYKIISSLEEKRIAFQNKGIDRRLFLRKKCESIQVTIEERYRKTYDTDFVFEIISNNVTNEAGWIKKELESDYVSFLFEGESFYLFNRESLQETFSKNEKEWTFLAKENKNGFYLKNQEYKNYNSVSIVVPNSIFIKEYKKVFSNKMAF